MALKITKETEHGVDIDYWKITNYAYFWSNGKGEITISGWQSKAKCNNYKKPLMQFIYISDTDFNTKTEMYTFIKTKSEFIAAVDD